MERAVELRPKSARFLAELGALYEVMDLIPEAEAMLRRALDLNPRDAPYLWRLANLKLRLGDMDEAVPLVGEAMDRDRSLADAGASLLLKSRVEPATVQRLWPTGPGMAGALLQHFLRLRSRAGLEITSSVLDHQWAQTLADDEPPTASQASAHLSYLADSERHVELRSAWIAWKARHGVEDPAFSSGITALWNGDFELEFAPGLIDWRVREAQHWRIARKPGLGEDGSVALVIDFLTVEGNFAGLRQQFVASPQASYLLSALVASEALDGPEVYFEVLDLASREPVARLPVGRGTAGWHEVSVRFAPPPASGLLRLTLRGDGRRSDSVLSGRLLLDKLAVRPLPAPPPGP